MIVLGWSGSDARPASLQVVRTDGLSVVYVASHAAADPRVRARLQVEAAEELPAFLPVAPAADFGLEAAVSLARRCAEQMHDKLDLLRGKAQISVRVDWPTRRTENGAVANGRQWLERRRSDTASDRARFGALRSRVCARFGCRPEMSRADQPARGAAQLDLLMPRERCEASMERLAQGKEWLDLDLTGALTITGPWPAYSFSTLGAAA